jgi:hypothetical protein
MQLAIHLRYQSPRRAPNEMQKLRKQWQREQIGFESQKREQAAAQPRRPPNGRLNPSKKPCLSTTQPELRPFSRSKNDTSRPFALQ